MAPQPTEARARQWRILAAIGLAAVGLSLFVIMALAGEVIPPVIVFGLIYLALGAAIYRWIERPRVVIAAATLGLLGLLANLPFLISDLSHIDTWASFIPNVFAVCLGLSGIAAGYISVFRPALTGARPLGLGATALAAVLAVLSIALSVAATSDPAQAGDLQVIAKDVEYPETLTAGAGLVGIHVDNQDLFFHNFVIEELDVTLELPGSKARRLEVQLAPGEYRYACTVPGHERMEGTLTVR